MTIAAMAQSRQASGHFKQEPADLVCLRHILSDPRVFLSHTLILISYGFFVEQLFLFCPSLYLCPRVWHDLACTSLQASQLELDSARVLSMAQWPTDGNFHHGEMSRWREKSIITSSFCGWKSFHAYCWLVGLDLMLLHLFQKTAG